MWDEDDREGLVRALALGGSGDAEGAADFLLNSEWLLRHDYRTVRSFLKGCLEGIPSE